MDASVVKKRRWIIELAVAWGLVWALVASSLLGLIYLSPFPGGWLEARGGSVRVVDRDGVLLRHLAERGGARRIAVRRDQIAEGLVEATLAGEDHRFADHPGVDLWAIVRASKLNLERGAVYSGASTLTMQLVRLVDPRPPQRGLRYKVEQAVLALRLERVLSKEEILVAYLNRAPYGNNTFGVEAASALYFHKRAKDLTLSEASFLAVLPRGPTRYNPYREGGLARAKERQHHILSLMRERGQITAAAYEEALRSPIEICERDAPFEAPHLVDALVRREHPREVGVSTIRTTLDVRLQQRVEAQVAYRARMLPRELEAQAAVVVMDVDSGDIRAIVGSRGWQSEGGQFNAALAERPVGTTILPLIYGLAFEQDLSAARVLADVPELDDEARLRIANRSGSYAGPVSARRALAEGRLSASEEVVRWVGMTTVVERAREFGMELDPSEGLRWSLERPSRSGRTRLIDLVALYGTLARGGEFRPARQVDRLETSGGTIVEPSQGGQVLDPRASWLVNDILADEQARVDAFGPGRGPIFDYPVAVSVHVDDGGRDLWAFGYTPQVVVGVWVGRFDGKALRGLGALEGPVPIMKDVVEIAMMGYEPTLFARPDKLVEAEVCPTSGHLPGPDCPHRVREVFVEGSVPEAVCDAHIQVPMDLRNGRIASWSCEDGSVVVPMTFARLPVVYDHWRRHKGLGELSANRSPLCAQADDDHFFPRVDLERGLVAQSELDRATRPSPLGLVLGRVH